ncbi:hypothetical protein EW026_g3874 [Hermanssonia centrifuga]|uniref:Uncharacterized protein n=1 Tax=Hermanssonia centrifuga TaxID=98765 RepID=A0A4V3XAJ0_9APHY|nr:hypothetical protein EW026_g3874 [Hermanssonia centrifuga]
MSEETLAALTNIDIGKFWDLKGQVFEKLKTTRIFEVLPNDILCVGQTDHAGPEYSSFIRINNVKPGIWKSLVVPKEGGNASPPVLIEAEIHWIGAGQVDYLNPASSKIGVDKAGEEKKWEKIGTFSTDGGVGILTQSSFPPNNILSRLLANVQREGQDHNPEDDLVTVWHEISKANEDEDGFGGNVDVPVPGGLMCDPLDESATYPVYVHIEDKVTGEEDVNEGTADIVSAVRIVFARE